MEALTIHRAVQLLSPSPRERALLLHGDPDVRVLALELAVTTATGGGTVLWVEAANRFDLAAVTDSAKQWGKNPQPLLRCLRIARAFTVHQLATLCTEGLEAALSHHPGAWTVISEPLALCWDAEVSVAEARRQVRKIAAGLTRMRARGHRLVITSPDPPAAFGDRADLLEPLARLVTRTVTVRAVEAGLVLSELPPRAEGRLASGG